MRDRSFRLFNRKVCTYVLQVLVADGERAVPVDAAVPVDRVEGERHAYCPVVVWVSLQLDGWVGSA